MNKDIHGFLSVDKPKGMTSFDVCNVIKKKFKIPKVGHSGTLDPQATGLLIIALNKATRAIRFLPSTQKIYSVTIEWGLETDSWDLEGKVVRRENKVPDPAAVAKAIPDLIGEPILPVPYFSAKKLNGQRMYKLAREGDYRKVEKAMRVDKIEITGDDSLKITCASGTYVRSIVYQLGEMVGCPATTAELTRLQNNGFDLKDALTLDHLLQCETIYDKLVDLNDALKEIKPVYIDRKTYDALSLGNMPPRAVFNGSGLFRLVYNGKLAAVTEVGAKIKITNFT